MIIKKEASEIWEEYEHGVGYNETIGLYDTVAENEDFFVGKQWEGVKAPDLSKPVLNILKRCVTYFISTIASDDIGTQLLSFDEDEETEELMSSYARSVDRIFERDHTKNKLRSVIRNAAVDGDGVLYWYWDGTLKTGTAIEGDIRSELVQNTMVMFGNPYGHELQKQPYIIVALRKPLDEVRDEAKANGIREWETIQADDDCNQGEEGNNSELCTVLTKLWKDDGKVHAIKCAHNVLIRKEWDMEMDLYPVAWMRWDKVRSCYHGQAAVTGLIPNQITINKLFAMYIKSVEMNAFPKVVYDVTKFGRGGWTNRVGEAIGVNGAVNEAAVNVLRGGDVSAQVMEVINTCISLTKDCIGANDAALGSVRPEQAAASAIIATQQASAAPLELQRQEFFDFVEQCVYIILDFMGSFYGVRESKIEKPGEVQIDPATGQPIQGDGTVERAAVDYSRIKDLVEDIEVSVGSSAYWSELAQMQTMDNLLKAGIISDTVEYLESVPDKWLPNKQKLIDAAKKTQQAQLQQDQMMAQQQGAPQAAVPQDAPLPSGSMENYYNSML